MSECCYILILGLGLKVSDSKQQLQQQRAIKYRRNRVVCFSLSSSMKQNDTKTLKQISCLLGIVAKRQFMNRFYCAQSIALVATVIS